MKMTKIFAVVTAMVLAVSMLAGCNGRTSNGGTVPKPVLPEGTNGKITKDPLELTIFLHMGGLGAFNDDMAYFKEAFDKTNIKLHGTASASNVDRTQEFNVMLTSDPLPDIVHGTNGELNNAGIDGAMFPLDDLIEKYAPNIKKLLADDPTIKASCAAWDGNLYFIPNMFTGLPSEGFYIRQDWLDKLGLEVPKTVQEYHDVLKAFLDRDPNGNGRKDEVPYFCRFTGIDALLQLFDAYYGFQVTPDGKVYHARTQPQYKNGMQNLAQWYKDGLIDKEIFSRGQKAREQLLGDNVGGATHDWFSSCGSFNKLSSQIPGFKWVAIPPPADVNGVVKESATRKRLSGYGWGISRDNKYPVETIKYLDFWMSDAGKRLFSYGVEGVDYTWGADGNPVVADVVKNAPESPTKYLRARGQHEFGTIMQIDAELAIMNNYAREGYKMYLDNGYCEVLPKMPVLSFTEEEGRVLKETASGCETYMNEQHQKWFMGTEPLNDDTWNAYLAQLQTLGIDRYVATYQSAYDRYAAFVKEQGKK